MSWSHYSRGALLAVLIVAVAATGVATAVSVSDESVPDDAEVGSEVTVEITLDELYSEYDAWTLEGETQLENVTWSVEYRDGETTIATEELDGQTISQPGIDRSDEQEPRQIDVVVTGEVPAVENYSYDERETFDAVTLTQTRGENGTANEIDTWEVHHYTTGEDEPGSREARQAIDGATSTVEEAGDAGADVSQAETTLENAVQAYDEGNFQLAVDLAEQAENEATDAEEGAAFRQTLLYGGIAVVVLLVLGVGGYVFLQRRDTTQDPLR